ncbi:hypothetical protein IP88_14530 [alpha proteobacterium AAP81b]|nr:hypothetical protein IP88_14530 [alpha proteobacterium AAP81b]
MTGYRPPEAVARAAARGLELREQFGRGGTEVGVERAEQLRDRRPVSDDDITAISSYFKRHAVDRDARAHRWGDESDPSAGYIAWLLWGGDAGEQWADGIRADTRDKP